MMSKNDFRNAITIAMNFVDYGCRSTEKSYKYVNFHDTESVMLTTAINKIDKGHCTTLNYISKRKNHWALKL